MIGTDGHVDAYRPNLSEFNPHISDLYTLISLLSNPSFLLSIHHNGRSMSIAPSLITPPTYLLQSH